MKLKVAGLGQANIRWTMNGRSEPLLMWSTRDNHDDMERYVSSVVDGTHVLIIELTRSELTPE